MQPYAKHMCNVRTISIYKRGCCFQAADVYSSRAAVLTPGPSLCFRLIQVSRSGRDLLRAAAAAAPACGAVLAVWLTAAVFFATVMHWSDRDVAYEPNSLPEALYMTVITMTTVGYGDMIPVTPVAKVFGCLCAYTGCALAALPAALLVVKFAQLRAAEEPQHAGGKGATDGAVLCTRM